MPIPMIEMVFLPFIFSNFDELYFFRIVESNAIMRKPEYVKRMILFIWAPIKIGFPMSKSLPTIEKSGTRNANDGRMNNTERNVKTMIISKLGKGWICKPTRIVLPIIPARMNRIKKQTSVKIEMFFWIIIFLIFIILISQVSLWMYFLF